jgi:glucokinase
MDNYLGIEIGGTKIQLVASDQDLNVLGHSHFLVGQIKDANFIRKEIEKRIADHLSRVSIKSIGVGFGGPILQATGQVYKSFQVDGWEGFNLKNWLTEKTGVPTFVDNDANIAALAESILGSGKLYESAFYITLGSGVGGGFILKNEIYHGREPGEFEIGHIRIDKTGTTLESCCSGWALNNKLKHYIESHPESALAKFAGEDSGNGSKYLIKAIQDGDERADFIFQEMIDNLAYGLSHLIHLVNPEVIIIGGGLSLIGEYLKESLKQSLPNYLMEPMKNKLPDVRMAELGELVVPLGAISLAINEMKKNN